MELLDALQWRYATKRYRDKKVASDTIEKIVEAINLSASSTGIQPYRVVVVENKELQKRLGEGSFNLQITEASHLIVFAAMTGLTKQYIENYMQHVAKVREIPEAAISDYKDKLNSYLLARSDEENFQWATRQAYIGLGTGLIAAAELQVDSTPMEGFDAAKFDELLGLKERGLQSVVIMALGYRDEDKDAFSKMKKVRLPLEEMVETVS